MFVVVVVVFCFVVNIIFPADKYLTHSISTPVDVPSRLDKLPRFFFSSSTNPLQDCPPVLGTHLGNRGIYVPVLVQ